MGGTRSPSVGNLKRRYDNYLQTNNGGAIISFNGSWTAALASNKGLALGSDYADFLLGYGLGAGPHSEIRDREPGHLRTGRRKRATRVSSLMTLARDKQTHLQPRSALRARGAVDGTL